MIPTHLVDGGKVIVDARALIYACFITSDS